MFGRGWRLARIGGVSIFVEPSVLLIGILIALQAWDAFSNPFSFPGLSRGAAAALSLLTAVLFFGSILAHELAHAGMSLARGIPIRGITLYMLGGLTHQAKESKGPLDEFLVTVVGPAVTGVLGVIFLVLYRSGPGTLSHPWRALFGYLALVNLLMAGLNALPGFPLDGGRVLLSGLWRITGDRGRALQIAARVGQVVAGLIVAGGLFLATTTGDLLLGVWAAFVGWFLYQSATAARSEGTRRLLLRTTRARDIMSPPPPAVPSDMPVGSVTRRYLAGHDGEAFPVVAAGHVVGFVSSRTARGVGLDRPVREAMAGPDAAIEAGPNDRMDEIGERLGEHQVQVVLVFDEGRLVGVIEPEDLTRMNRRHRAAIRTRTRSG